MANGDVMSGDRVTIYIEDADTIGTGLTTEVQSEVTSFNTSGGETDYESKPVFGGFIDLKKPQEQLEITMDVIMRFDSTEAKVKSWDILRRTDTRKLIAIEATDGGATPNYYWNAFNNVRSVNFDKEFEADAEWKGTMTFKLSPRTADGKDNIKEGGGDASIKDATDGLTDWD